MERTQTLRYLRCYSVIFVLMAKGKHRDFNSDLVE